MQNLNRVEDVRGLFEELSKGEHGQVSIFTINPNESRGNHYHKKTTEVFTVIEGECICTFQEPKMHPMTIRLGKGNAICITPFTNHAFANTMDKVCKILLWRPDIFDPDNPDVFYD